MAIRAAAQQAWETAVQAYSDALLNGSISQRTQAAAELKTIAQGIVDQYGSAAAYEASRFCDESIGLGTRLAEATGLAETKNSVGYSVDRTFVDGADNAAIASFASYMGGTIGMWLFDRANQTIKANGAARGGCSYARIPTGFETCAFCLMLAGRGFVYDADTVMAHVHPSCDCVCVVTRDAKTGIGGYDPDKYEKMYKASIETDEEGNVDLKRTLKAMRRRYGLK